MDDRGCAALRGAAGGDGGSHHGRLHGRDCHWLHRDGVDGDGGVVEDVLREGEAFLHGRRLSIVPPPGEAEAEPVLDAIPRPRMQLDRDFHLERRQAPAGNLVRFRRNVHRLSLLVAGRAREQVERHPLDDARQGEGVVLAHEGCPRVRAPLLDLLGGRRAARSGRNPSEDSMHFGAVVDIPDDEPDQHFPVFELRLFCRAQKSRRELLGRRVEVVGRDRHVGRVHG
mmetsp:Transcript_53566/g.127383  ORF Transcript_53566/g.127383 Transcript_53566/m.127383 type:complete len:227 (+) Transcript_53566:349-1029(+)